MHSIFYRAPDPVKSCRCLASQENSIPFLLQVVKILKGEDGPLEWKQNSVSGRALLLDACDLDDYSCTAYLNDLDRHMKLVLE